MAVDDAVIEAGGQVHHLAHDHLAAPHHDALLDLVRTDDGDFGVVDDGRVHHAAERAQRGDGDGRAAELLALGAAVLGGARDAGDLFGCLVGVARLGVADDRDHQAVRRLGGDAQMDGVVLGQHARLVIIGGVDVRLVLQGHDDGAGDEGQDVQLGLPRALVLGVQVGAQLFHRRHVDVLDIGDVGDATDALGHLLRDLAAQADDADFVGSFGLGVERAARSRGRGERAAARHEGVQVGVLDAAGGAAAGHENQVDPQVARAVAHGRRGQRALARLAAGQGRNGLGVGLGRSGRLGGRCGDRSRRGLLGLGGRRRSGGGGFGDVALARHVEADQRAADGDLLTGFAMQGDDDAGDRAGQFDRRLVGHDLGQNLVFLDRVADLHMPADQFGFSGAFADVRQFEDVVGSGCGRRPLRRLRRHLPIGMGRRKRGLFLPTLWGGGPRSGGGAFGDRFRIAFALDLELGQGASHGHHLAGLAVQGGDDARDRAGQFDRGLVGHDVGDDLVLGDGVADLDVPADQFGLGGAFANVRKLENKTTHLSDLPS